jgi:hypothetical protein
VEPAEPIIAGIAWMCEAMGSAGSTHPTIGNTLPKLRHRVLSLGSGSKVKGTGNGTMRNETFICDAFWSPDDAVFSIKIKGGVK